MTKFKKKQLTKYEKALIIEYGLHLHIESFQAIITDHSFRVEAIRTAGSTADWRYLPPY